MLGLGSRIQGLGAQDLRAEVVQLFTLMLVLGLMYGEYNIT